MQADSADPFSRCLPVTLREESGERQVWGKPIVRGRWSYLDHPRDPGGATMCGVTHKVYDAWRDLCGQPRRDVREIEDHEIVGIFRRQYWDAVPCDGLPAGVDLAVFDAAVHTGPVQAVKFLQRAVGATADGHIGGATLAAVHRMAADNVVARLMTERRRHGRALKNFEAFSKGWTARWERVERAALAMCLVAPGWQQDIIVARAPGGELEGEVGAAQVVPSPRATSPVTESMSQSTTARAAEAAGGLSAVQLGTEVAGAASRARGPSGIDWLALGLALAQSPAFWLAAGAIVAASYIWLERWRRIITGG